MKIINIFNNKEIDKSKDWRDAFVEEKLIKSKQKIYYSLAYTIKINNCSLCNKYVVLCAYVSQFNLGGFWFSKDGLFFVTSGIKSDESATYEDAVEFIKQWSSIK